MAQEIKLEALTFGIRELRAPAEKASYLPLHQLQGKDFYQSFKDYLSKIEVTQIDEGFKSGFGLQSNSLVTAATERTYRGIFKGGHFGIESELENIKTKKIKKKEADDIDKVPFYFLIHIPRMNVGVFLIQRLGVLGISTILRKSLQNYIRTTFTDLIIDFNPLVSRELARTFVDDGHIKEIVLTKYNLPSDRVERLGLKEYQEDILSIEVRIKAKRKSWFTGINKKLKNFVGDGDPRFFDVRAIRELGFDGNHEVKVVSKLNGNNRTIDINNFGEIRPYYDISKDVERTKGGHPKFESIDSIAKTLLNELLNEKA